VIAKLEPGGAQLTVLSLTRALRVHGVETRLLAGHATPAGLRLAREHGIEVEVWADDPELQYACREGFATWLEPRLREADLVHAHMFGAWWAAARAGPTVPLVASEHNDLRWPGAPQHEEMRRALERVAVLFAHGPAVRAEMIAVGLAPDRLRSGLSPIGGLDAEPDPELPAGRVVFAGRLHPEKGPDILLEALGLMQRRPPTFILGLGPMEAELRSRAAELGLDHVRFTGWVADPQRWIAGASACVVPSRHEAWSRAAMLAMGLGTPVIGTAVEGLPDTLADGRGLLITKPCARELADTLDELLAGRRTADLPAARRFATRFTPKRVAMEYWAEYVSLCENASELRYAGLPSRSTS
jgi:glycosyltransferase involved in cell wall biosynthesis